MTNKSKYIQTIEDLAHNKNLRTFRNDIDSFTYNLSSNDYLNLNNREDLYAQFNDEYSFTKKKYSSTSSRLLTGNSSEYVALEQTLQSSFNREACLLFNSGYHANCGILPALTDSNDLIIADKLVHASIIDGIRLSKAKLERYKHLDYNHLERILQKRSDYNNVFIVTESIFSMDGDIADLQLLVALKEKYNAFLYVDEAHAIGTRGEQGLGCVEEQNCINNVDFIVGTFGKAIVSVGAYVICDSVFKDYLINTARTLIFTTALPPVNLAWTNFICRNLVQFKQERMSLHELSNKFAQAIGEQSTSNIIPYIIGENTDAIAKAEQLQKLGYLVLPIRYPTVAKGTARLRFSLHAGLKFSDIEPIIHLLKE